MIQLARYVGWRASVSFTQTRRSSFNQSNEMNYATRRYYLMSKLREHSLTSYVPKEPISYKNFRVE